VASHAEVGVKVVRTADRETKYRTLPGVHEFKIIVDCSKSAQEIFQAASAPVFFVANLTANRLVPYLIDSQCDILIKNLWESQMFLKIKISSSFAIRKCRRQTVTVYDVITKTLLKQQIIDCVLFTVCFWLTWCKKIIEIG